MLRSMRQQGSLCAFSSPNPRCSPSIWMLISRSSFSATSTPWTILPSEPIWLSVDRVVYINRRLVELTGEPHFLRDPGMLESAMMRAQNHWSYGEVDMVVLAGSLLLGINRNHPFE